MEIGISLGWRCEASQILVRRKLRNTKIEGYMTCPFDIGITNYIGICKCIEDDFKYFCDPNYLILREEPKLKKILGDNQTEDQYWIYNTYYNFAFNHESPGHGNLYLSENWEGGINHFVNNNFQKFIDRYTNRINNFKNYLNLDNVKINFLLLRYNSIPYKLIDIIKNKYPKLNFVIHCAINYSNESLNISLKKNKEGIKEFDIEYLKYLNISKEQYPEEYERYEKNMNKEEYDKINNSYINILYLD
jgi:hypothetical protein